MTTWLVHGIRTADPTKTLGGLKGQLIERGVQTGIIDYGWIAMPVTNGKARAAIRKHAKPGCTLVGYSNGGYAVWQEAERVKPRHVVLISPALRADVEWPECVESVTVYYSPGDWAVRLGGAYSFGVSMMPWRWGTPHGFGRMGVDGPATNDPRVTAIEMGRDIAHDWHRYPQKVAAIADRVASL